MGLWVVLSVMGVVAGMASWETEAVDARGCPTEGAPVAMLTIVLWLLGLALAAAGLWVNLRRDRRCREVGVRRRLPIIDVLLLLGALVLPWAVYISGFNLCWT